VVGRSMGRTARTLSAQFPVSLPSGAQRNNGGPVDNAEFLDRRSLPGAIGGKRSTRQITVPKDSK
jgi:hypothetical protein